IVRHVGSVADAAVAGNHECAAFGAEFSYGEIENMIQAVYHALQATAVGEIDDGVTRGEKNIARADDIRGPKKHDAIAVGMSGGFMENLDPFAIEKLAEFHLIAQECQCWQGFERDRWLTVGA